MKRWKQWLFPALTCLLVLGAAVLPQQISQARDARQFGQVHTERMDADALPTADPPTLLDRIALYSSQNSSSHPVLSFRDPVYYADQESEDPELTALAESIQDMLVEAEVLPNWIFWEEAEPFDSVSAIRILLWDPEEADTFQQPASFWEITWDYSSNKDHQKTIRVTLDAETNLPISLYVNDTDMSQWFPYDIDSLRDLSEHFFGLLELEVQETDLAGPMYVPSLNLSYSIAETGMNFFVSRAPTNLLIQTDYNWRLRTDTGSISTAYDG